MRVHLVLLWLAALLLRSATQSGGLTLSASAGFDGLYRQSAAVPVVVAVRNDGAALEGEIRVAVPDSGGGETIFSAPVSLPTQSDKRVALYIHVPPFTGSVEVQLVGDGQVRASALADGLGAVLDDELLYGVVSPDPGGLAFLETVAGDRSGAEVAFLDLVDLPDVSIAWRALDVLVFDDVDTSRLTAGQLLALRAWVENGGHLVVTGGPGAPKTAAAIAGLLPVTVGGVESVDALPALASFAGTPISTPGPYALAGSSLIRGEMAIHQDGLPVLVHDRLGLGRVTFLALDPKLAPLAGWPGQPAVWQAVAMQTPAPGPWTRGIQNSYTAGQAVAAISGLRLPSVGQLLLFLAAYTLVIGPINFLVLRRLRRRELAWITVPVLVLLFSAVTYFTGFRARGNAALLNEMTVIYGSISAEQTRAQSIVGLYSPNRGRYDLSLPYETVAYPNEGAFGSGAGPVALDAIVRAGDLTLSDIRSDTGQVSAFVIDAHAPRPALSGEAHDEGSAILATVRNDGEAVLQNAVLVFGDQQFPLGDIAAGETREARLPLASITPATPPPLFPTSAAAPNALINDPSYILGTADYYNDAESYGRWQLLQSLYVYTETPSATASETVTLGGWLPAGVQTIDPGDTAMTRSGATLVLLEIPVR